MKESEYVKKLINAFANITSPEETELFLNDLCSDAELTANIISISTIEHIDMHEYGIESVGAVSAVDVLKRIVANAQKYFITFPLGHNKQLDEYVLNSVDMNEIYVTRSENDRNDWNVVGKNNLTPDMKRYGTYLNANTICVLMKS